MLFYYYTYENVANMQCQNSLMESSYFPQTTCRHRQTKGRIVKGILQQMKNLSQAFLQCLNSTLFYSLN